MLEIIAYMIDVSFVTVVRKKTCLSFPSFGSPSNVRCVNSLKMSASR